MSRTPIDRGVERPSKNSSWGAAEALGGSWWGWAQPRKGEAVRGVAGTGRLAGHAHRVTSIGWGGGSVCQLGWNFPAINLS